MIPFLDVRVREVELISRIDKAIQRVVRSGHYLLGEESELFELELAAREEVRHCVTVGSGLDALTLILRALGIGPGDEVLVPSHTFIATWLAVIHAGATPIPVEPEARGYNMDVRAATSAVTGRTAAIMPANLYGSPADLVGLEDLAKRQGLALIADAAQSLGSTISGRRASSWGHASATSFYPGKNLGALGDGGAILTNDEVLDRKLRMLRNYGSEFKYRHDTDGWNSRLDEIQAAVLREKLPHLDGWNARRRQIASQYQAGLAKSGVSVPQFFGDQDSVWHIYAIRASRRNELQACLRKLGVETLIHYPVPPHRQPALAQYGHYVLPRAEEIGRTVLSLPIGPNMSDLEVARVIDAVVYCQKELEEDDVK